MNNLQALAFERIQTLNKEVREMLPKHWRMDDFEFKMNLEEMKLMADRLYEQAELIEALLEEEQRDGGGD